MKTNYKTGLAAAVSAIAMLTTAGMANATVLLTSGNQPGLDQVHGAGGNQTGHTVYGTVDGESVSFHSSDWLNVNGSGQAFVDGTGSHSNFDNLTVSLTDYAYGFSEMNFNLERYGHTNFHATIQVYGLDDQLLASFDRVIGSGNNKYYLHGDDNEVFSKVVFLAACDYAFGSARQFDIGLAPPPPPPPPPVTGVPEPTTWALMIGGFGMAGAALRRRSVRTA